MVYIVAVGFLLLLLCSGGFVSWLSVCDLRATMLVYFWGLCIGFLCCVYLGLGVYLRVFTALFFCFVAITLGYFVIVFG